MQQPKKFKYRKQMKQSRKLRGTETRGCEVSFGDFGLQAMESGWITARQIEASRVALTRHAKRGGKVWIRMFPDKPITTKPAETRMGKGKGAPDHWVATIRAGRVMFEITGVEKPLAKRALELAAAKLPIKCQVIERSKTIL
ncbi:MAG: 50S ribosomal protein L16 [Bdellovibrionales bacterium]|nr:50S ribosomal protein L16 [Bdellovibrionales bacterium]